MKRALARQEFRRLCQGVYLVGGAPYTLRARLWAGVLATDGVLFRHTAGRLWDVLDEDDGFVHLHVSHARRVHIPDGVRVHRCAAFGVRTQLSALPVFDRSATIVELLGCLRSTVAGRLADRALQQRWVSAEDLERRLRFQPKRPGNTQLRRLLAQLGDGAASESERLLHRLLRRAGIDGWTANYPVWADGGLVGVLDAAIPARRIAIEVDGMAYHVDVDRFRRDRRRQNALVALGWTVLRFTWADLTERPAYVIATIRRLAA